VNRKRSSLFLPALSARKRRGNKKLVENQAAPLLVAYDSIERGKAGSVLLQTVSNYEKFSTCFLQLQIPSHDNERERNLP
jgi:hypothetical protein